MWSTIGHNSVKSVLSEQLSHNKLAHAYLFVGLKGVGKATFAREFAYKAIGKLDPVENVDIRHVILSSEFGVKDTRELISTLHSRSGSGGRQVLIVEDAHLLNKQGVNALLKTLEEPGDSILMIFLAQSRTLPDTFISRCQYFYFNPLTKIELKEYCNSKGYVVTEEQIDLCAGSIGELEMYIRDKEYYLKVQSRAEQFMNICNSSLGARLNIINELTLLDADELLSIIRIWECFLRTKDLSGELVLKAFCALEDARKNFVTNMNKKLIIEKMLLALPSL